MRTKRQDRGNPSITCGITAIRAVDPYRPAGGETFGAYIAESEIVKASSELDDGIHWDFWVPDLVHGGAENVLSTANSQALGALRSTLGDRFEVRLFSSLADVVRRRRNYVFVSTVPGMAKISDFREHLGAVRLPICGLLHSAIGPDLAFMYAWMILGLRRGDVLVATSTSGRLVVEKLLDAARERLGSIAGTGITASWDIAQIPFGVEIPPERALDRLSARTLLRIPLDVSAILYVGRLSERFKADLDCLLRVFARLAARRNDVRLIIAGRTQDPAYGAYLRSMLATLGIANDTILIENFPDIIKSSIYAAADVFVSPSDSVQETFGLTILEAMAHARPVIAPSWSGYRDLVVHNNTGFLIRTHWSSEAAGFASMQAPIADVYELAAYLARRTIIDVDELMARVTELLDNPLQADEMGRRGRERVIENFSWKAIARRYLDLWKHQAGVVKATKPRTSPLSLDDVFGHYADRVLSPDDLVERSASVPNQPGFAFPVGRKDDVVVRLLRLFDGGPVRIKDLRRKGVAIEVVMWLCKKGLCRLVPAE